MAAKNAKGAKKNRESQEAGLKPAAAKHRAVGILRGECFLHYA